MKTGSSSSSKLDRKALKRPDEFHATIQSGFDWMARNPRKFFISIGVIIAVFGVGLIYSKHRNVVADSGRLALFQAKQALSKEYQVLIETKTGKTAVTDPKRSKDAEEAEKAKLMQENAVLTMIEKLDVDAKFPQSVKLMSEVSKQYHGTRPGYDAELTLGKLYFDHGEFQKSIPWYKNAIDSAPESFEKTMAYYSLGYSLESLTQYNEAIAQYEKALSFGEANVKPDLLLAMARCQESAKDLAKAKSTYEKIVSEYPNTQYAASAEVYLSAIKQ